jgi:hypothetical protein
MESFTPQLRRLLTSAGCHFVRAGKGDQITQFNFVLDSKIKSRHTANAVLR